MNIVIFGASGMVGYGVLLEALDSADVTHILSIGRRKLNLDHPKLRQLIHDDYLDFESIADELAGFDACLWCLGITSAGLDEAEYTRITHDFTVAAATVLRDRNPNLRFCFLSGSGADSSEKSRVMWARVKGKAENALFGMGFREVTVFRPAMIQPMRGAKPRGNLRWIYMLFGFIYPVIRALGGATSTVDVGRAMIAAAMGHSTRRILNSRLINELAKSASG